MSFPSPAGRLFVDEGTMISMVLALGAVQALARCLMPAGYVALAPGQ